MSLLSRLAVEAARGFGLFSQKSGILADYLVVAGGGGGGSNIQAYNGGTGGGGAGGYQTSTFTLSTLNTYTITVGAGGAGGVSGSAVPGINGVNSVISGTGLTTVTSIGGGGGGKSSATASPGNSGGSGGGGGGTGSATSVGGTATSGQGNNGGTSTQAGANYGAAGGGGAGAVGGSTTNSNNGGNGGAGSSSSISGSSVTYAGGGGGGAYSPGTAGTGGSGGGGNGSNNTNGNAGTANLGGGGGGAGSAAANSLGGNGGSGIVIISYTSATPKFVGGTITTSGGKQIHTFTSSGTLTPVTQVTASYLVVAGGGGSARQLGGFAGNGGGGAGGLLSGSTTLYSPATYIVTVGAGGAGGTTSGVAPSGSNSVLSGTGITTQTATGGGGGGGSTGPGANGGSGGGGSGEGTRAGGTGTSGQGNNGGNGVNAGGGGGGSGAVGANAVTTTGGAGGIGTQSSISGTATYYAGGGGGGAYSSGTAGAGGSGGGGNGGAGTSNTGNSPGTQNTGGGAGGTAGDPATAVNGQSGGSGVVIISYAGSQVFNGGTVTTSGGNTIHTFYATGALTPITNNLTNSLRFRSSASAYLNRTFTTPTNNKIFTYSVWVKRGALGNNYGLFSPASSGTGYTTFRFESDDTINFQEYTGSAYNYQLDTTQVFRDPSAWYHLVVAVDTTQATAANRIKLYVNGNQVTAFATASYPTQNSNPFFNSAVVHRVGANNYTGSAEQFFDGYMDDIYFIDGQALEPYYFGSNDSNNVWKPIRYYGTYGTNGFYLNFGNTTSTTTLGFDSSPNGNNWTTNNISLTAGTTYDAMTDVPTNTSATAANYCVLNPLDVNAVTSITEANLYSSLTASGSAIVRSTIAVTSGKWYWEVTFGSTGDTLMVGVCDATTALTNSLWSTTNAWAYYSNNGNKYNSSSAAYGATFTNNDIIGVALDMDAGTLVFYKNNVSQGTAYSSGLTGKTLTPTIQSAARALTAYANFGQRPFSYTPPTGFVALNTYNLPTPTIIQGNRYMDATLYAGNTVGLNIVNASQFKPDLVWIKDRSQVTSHVLTDSVRGTSAQLFSNLTNAEQTNSTYVTSFNSNGFTVGVGNSGTGVVNNSGDNFVGWQWQAGQGTTSSNTSGSITSTVSVNTTAGFSVVTYTGVGGTGTVGHGLGVAPKMILLKRRNSAVNWYVWHTSLGATQVIEGLNTTGAASTQITFNNTLPTSSVISLGNNDSNFSGGTYVLYVWAEIAGFSRFGSYTGNGSADGPFIFTGFRPKWFLIKQTNVTRNWILVDSVRNSFNIVNNPLLPNASDAEYTSTTTVFDFVSNGIKIRSSHVEGNGSGDTYIYAAFAENPFKNSNAR